MCIRLLRKREGPQHFIFLRFISSVNCELKREWPFERDFIHFYRVHAGFDLIVFYDLCFEDVAWLIVIFSEEFKEMGAVFLVELLLSMIYRAAPILNRAEIRNSRRL